MSVVSRRTRPLTAYLLCLVGPVIWAGHLFLLYGGATLICLGPPTAGSRIFLVFAAIVTASALTGLAFALGRFRRLQTSYPAVALPACTTPVFN
jgi:hypothetical protein